MAKKYDDFDEADSDGVFAQVFGLISNHRRGFAVVTVSVAVLLLGLIIWSSYPDGASDPASESVPIVRAEDGSYKSAPENPGGMEVPYRDSTVFSSNEADGGTENILADTSEQPVSRESAFAGLNTSPDAAPTVPGTAAQPPMGEVEATQAMNAAPGVAAPGTSASGTSTSGAAPGKVEPVLPPSDDALVKEALGTDMAAGTPPMPEPITPDAAKAQSSAKAETARVEPKIEPSKIEPAAGTTASKVKPGGYYVQLASVKSTAGAASEYKKIQAKHSALSGVDYRTQEANLGAKGTFYRIQAGPMSKDSATSICGSIKSGGGSCLVTGK